MAKQWYQRRVRGDRIVSADCGSGYVNPTQLLSPREISGLPSCDVLWQNHNYPYYRKFSITFTGFLINGFSGLLTTDAERMYIPFSWDGFFEQPGYEPPGMPHPYHLIDNTPVFEETDTPDSADETAALIINNAIPSKLQFQVYRAINKSPTWFSQVVDELKSYPYIAVVDPISLAYLARYSMGGNNDYRVAFINDNLQHTIPAGSSFSLNVTLRNDGWNTITAADTRLHCHFDSLDSSESCKFPVNQDITCGGFGFVSGTVRGTPTVVGDHTFTYQLMTAGGKLFSTLGNLPWLTSIQIL
eukprot:TRINITY_DN1196_c0_g1_i1.p1 TRINITY_DN1196_c0_g1~~TRINITY_DN1196_c0_g1_i1.p1  ORF type:complete len:301 (-),score=69.66 TRINITY_DN1196_c0_g1_i1:83-985(-)